MPPALLLESISKQYAGHRAVDDLSLSVPRGSIYGILGPNGAGKSTTIRIALDIIARDSGKVRILDHDPGTDARVLRRVGYLPEERGLYRKMRVLDVILFFGRLKGLRTREARAEADRWLERMGLTEWRLARVEALSKGMQQKVQFITTVLHRPELLFLDEPAAGLDPVNQDVLRDTIRGVREEGRTVVFSTHNMSEAEQLCDRVCIIARGRKILDGELESIRRSNLGNRWRVEFDSPPRGAAETFGGDGRFDAVLAIPRGWEVTLPAGESPRGLLAALTELDEMPTRFERIQPSLHEIFVQHVGGGATVATRGEVIHA